MARQEEDHEDLLAEATALVERVELDLAGLAQPVIAGFRRDGSASVYFGSATAYHFNSLCELRRAYVDGLLYKAQRVLGSEVVHGHKRGGLASLERCRTATEVQLLRHDLTADETKGFLNTLAGHLTALRDGLEQGQFQLVGQVPADAEVVERVRDWLARLSPPIVIASSPRVR